MSKRKTHVNRDDIVEVISGAHKGQTGKVLRVLRNSDQVVIEGVRMIKKHARKSEDRPEGGIIELEGAIHISNVKLATAASKEA